MDSERKPIEIDPTSWVSRSRLKCPTPRKHEHWETREGRFFCFSCERYTSRNPYYDVLVDGTTGEYVTVDEVSLVEPGRSVAD
jgi:hypothetical protein